MNPPTFLRRAVGFVTVIAITTAVHGVPKLLRSFATTAIWMAALATFTLVGGAAELSAEAGKRPTNILFILADDVSADELAPYGGEIAMPHLQRLADEGVLFRNGWSTPLCGPSRAMIMTGKYPHHTGYYENHIPAPIEKDPRHLLILKMLKKAGYTTSMIGKKHDGTDADAGIYGADDWLIARYWDGHDGPRQNHWSPNRSDMYGISWYWHPGLIRNGKGVPTTASDFGPDLEVDHLLKFAGANKNRPFAAFWMTNLPHKAHEEVVGVPAGRWYYTDVPELDAQGRLTGGKVLGTLKSNMQYLDLLLGRLRTGLADNTIIFFSADNGTADIRGRNRVMDKNSYDRDDGIRVPFVVGGGAVKPRKPSDVLVDFTDFWPTFAQLAGYRGPMNTDGLSFAPYLLGEPFTPRVTIHTALSSARWVRDRDWLLDGRGRFHDTRGAANRDEYRDVSESADPEVITARQRFETYLQEIPLPDENDPATRRAWKRFRAMADGAPVKVFRAAYLK
jgi:arylsulfatase A